MPAATGQPILYAAGLQAWQRGLIPVRSTGCFGALLVGSAYVPDFEAHTNLNHITDEQYGDDWPQGGVTLSGVDIAMDAANDRVRLVFDAIAIEHASFADGKQLILYHRLPADPADRTLFCLCSLDQALKPVWGPVNIAAPDGVFRTPYGS